MVHDRLHRLVLAAVAAGALAACGGNLEEDDDPEPTPTATPTLGDMYAVTASGRVVTFNRGTPATIVSTVALTGLRPNETLVGIDVRPSDGKLYGLGSQGRLYTIDPATGTLVAKASLSVALDGTAFGVDFNPVADRLRIVSNTGQNLRVDVDSGDAIVDDAINGQGAPVVTASAYTNSFAGATTTQLYGIGANGATLFLQNPPNDGTLTTPLPTGIDATGTNGFDIDPRTNTAYAASVVDGQTRLYRIVLATGTATSVDAIGTGGPLVGLALAAPAAPIVLALTANNRLVGFDPAAPNTLTSNVAIGGLANGESVLGIDFRPANGRLYALTSNARLLTVNPQTGATSGAVALRADPTDSTSPYAGLGAGPHAVDFNPVADRLRIVSSAGANMRIDVDSGFVTTDAALNRPGVPPLVAGAAYTNSFVGASATRLYDLDAASDVLAEQTQPNNGTLTNVGGLGLAVDLENQVGFDIAGGDNGLVLAALSVGPAGAATLYTVSLATGTATLYRNTSGDAARSLIGGAGGPVIVDLAIRY